jgi:hypothetical protein
MSLMAKHRGNLCLLIFADYPHQPDTAEISLAKTDVQDFPVDIGVQLLQAPKGIRSRIPCLEPRNYCDVFGVAGAAGFAPEFEDLDPEPSDVLGEVVEGLTDTESVR